MPFAPTTEREAAAHANQRPHLSHLCESLRRLQWLRQALDLWNGAEGRRAMPQPHHFAIQLPNLRPSEIHWPWVER